MLRLKRPLPALPTNNQERRCRKWTRLFLEKLEERATPAITFQFNYSLDTSGFFNSPTARNLLQVAGQLLSSQLNDSLEAIDPSGSNTWTASFTNPSNSNNTVNLTNLSVPADTILVYAGGQNFNGATLGQGGPGGWSVQGSNDWYNVVASRGQTGALSATPTDFGPWGGSITFDVGANWSFADVGSSPGPGQYDFLSVATHELGHILGIGTAPSWFSDVSGNYFIGPHAEAIYGGPVPLQPGGAHWADGLTVNGVEAAMDPILLPGARKLFSPIDFAGLDDLGWNSNAGVQSGGATTTQTADVEYVTSLYQGILDRNPDAAGLVSWVETLESGASRTSVASGILNSPEALTDQITVFYETILGRAPDAGGLNSFVQAREQGASADQVLCAILGSHEAFSHGGGTDAAYLQLVYNVVLDRNPDAGGLVSWSAELNSGVSTATVVSQIMASPEALQVHVSNLYFQLLQRAPDAGGLASWIAQLAAGMNDETIRAAFLGSDEFFGLEQNSIASSDSSGAGMTYTQFPTDLWLSQDSLTSAPVRPNDTPGTKDSSSDGSSEPGQSKNGMAALATQANGTNQPAQRIGSWTPPKPCMCPICRAARGELNPSATHQATTPAPLVSHQVSSSS